MEKNQFDIEQVYTRIKCCGKIEGTSDANEDFHINHRGGYNFGHEFEGCVTVVTDDRLMKKFEPEYPID